MTPSAKTIQIYLPKGNPRGLRLAEITTIHTYNINLYLFLSLCRVRPAHR